MTPAHLAGYARHGIRMARTVKGGSRIFYVDAFERGGKAVGIAFAAHLAVGNDVEAGALLIANCKERRVILRLFQEFGRNAPELLGSHAWRKPGSQLGPVNQPVGLRV